jgi:hypothetical protein
MPSDFAIAEYDELSLAPLDDDTPEEFGQLDAPKADSAKDIYLQSQRFLSTNNLQKTIGRQVIHGVPVKADRSRLVVRISHTSSAEKCSKYWQLVSWSKDNRSEIDVAQTLDRDFIISLLRNVDESSANITTDDLRKTLQEVRDYIENATPRKLHADRTLRGNRSFIEHANLLASKGEIDPALDVLYDQTQELLLSGRFDKLDDALKSCHVDRLSVDIMLGILTATVAASSKLPSRKTFYQQVQIELTRQGKNAKELLAGLKG